MEILVRNNDAVHGMIASALTPILKTIEDHEKRTRHLERWVWVAIGAVAVIQVLAPGLNILWQKVLA